MNKRQRKKLGVAKGQPTPTRGTGGPPRPRNSMTRKALEALFAEYGWSYGWSLLPDGTLADLKVDLIVDPDVTLIDPVGVIGMWPRTVKL